MISPLDTSQSRPLILLIRLVQCMNAALQLRKVKQHGV